jgi:hypothetical protein
MNFGEAIQAMKDGKRVCRKSWENDTWITVNYIADYLPRISLGRDNSVDGHKPWYPSQEDMLENDWEIKTETQKVNNDMNGLLYLSLLMFFFALENLHKKQDTYCPFNGAATGGSNER